MVTTDHQNAAPSPAAGVPPNCPGFRRRSKSPTPKAAPNNTNASAPTSRAKPPEKNVASVDRQPLSRFRGIAMLSPELKNGWEKSTRCSRAGVTVIAATAASNCPRATPSTSSSGVLTSWNS